MIIKIDNNDDNGYAFEDALMKAQYMYPKPNNPFAQDIIGHARQIYDGELLENLYHSDPKLYETTQSRISKLDDYNFHRGHIP